MPVTLPDEHNYVVPRVRWDLFSLEDVYDFLCDRLPYRKIVRIQYGPLDCLSVTTILMPKQEGNSKVKIKVVPTEDSMIVETIVEADRASLKEKLRVAKRAGNVEAAKEIQKILEGKRIDGKK